MTQEQFEKLNPMIYLTPGAMGYGTKEALMTQGKFLSTHTFIFSTLSAGEAEVLKLRCGVYNQTPMRYEEVANELNLSVKYVKTAEQLALRKLRHPLRIKYLKTYTDETIDMNELDRFKKPNTRGL